MKEAGGWLMEQVTFQKTMASRGEGFRDTTLMGACMRWRKGLCVGMD
jgi:hypothetical protein